MVTASVVPTRGMTGYTVGYEFVSHAEKRPPIGVPQRGRLRAPADLIPLHCNEYRSVARIPSATLPNTLEIRRHDGLERKGGRSLLFRVT